MQEALSQNNETFLCPFVFEGDNEYEMCEVSVEHKDGWKAISILIDSGASNSIAPPGMFPEVKVLEKMPPELVYNIQQQEVTKSQI